MLTESELRALPIGARVVLPSGADAYPDFCIAEPLFGFVESHDAESVWIQIDKPFAELAEWNNRVQCWYWDDAPSHGVIPLWRYEFPDFDYTLPHIEGFTDSSWHNDTMPSLTNGKVTLWCDYAEAAKREFADGHRFYLAPADLDNGGHAIAESDDLAEIIEAIHAGA